MRDQIRPCRPPARCPELCASFLQAHTLPPARSDIDSFSPLENHDVCVFACTCACVRACSCVHCRYLYARTVCQCQCKICEVTRGRRIRLPVHFEERREALDCVWAQESQNQNGGTPIFGASEQYSFNGSACQSSR